MIFVLGQKVWHDLSRLTARIARPVYSEIFKVYSKCRPVCSKSWRQRNSHEEGRKSAANHTMLHSKQPSVCWSDHDDDDVASVGSFPVGIVTYLLTPARKGSNNKNLKNEQVTMYYKKHHYMMYWQCREACRRTVRGMQCNGMTGGIVNRQWWRIWSGQWALSPHDLSTTLE